jgi:3-deoxy-D-manno-octulosonate 8-phosphate phosphatase (KDO 8-P phosphatase)
MIKLFAMDVEETLTDGGVYMDGRGGEWKRFDIRTAWGIARPEGKRRVIAFGERAASRPRIREEGLGVDRVYNGAGDKLSVLRELPSGSVFRGEEIAYMGDDVNDLPAMEWARFGHSSRQRPARVKAASDWVTNSCGGMGPCAKPRTEDLGA